VDLRLEMRLPVVLLDGLALLLRRGCMCSGRRAAQVCDAPENTGGGTERHAWTQAPRDSWDLMASFEVVARPPEQTGKTF
jgi:hypothetical protein